MTQDAFGRGEVVCVCMITACFVTAALGKREKNLYSLQLLAPSACSGRIYTYKTAGTDKIRGV